MRISKRVKTAITHAIADLNSEIMLKYAWVLAQERVEKMREIEESTGILFPQGYRLINSLTKIAAES